MSAVHDARARGFTMIELLIALVIMAILVAVAIPSYERFVQKSRRAEGREVLTNIAQSQARFYANAGRYADTLAELGITSTTSENKFYTVTMAESGRGYRLSATPAGAQAKDPCGTLVLTDVGKREVSGTTLTAEECWR